MTAIQLIKKMSWDEIVLKILNDTRSNSLKFKGWLNSKEVLGNYFFSSYAWKRVYNISKELNEMDADHFIVVAGGEGTGKSTLSIQLASVIDPSFCVERICFSMLDFIKGVRKATQGQAFILDEGNLFLFSRDAQSLDNKAMVKLFALMRQRNLCVIINVPNFWTLETYVRDFRVNTLFYLPKNKKSRGRFTMFKGTGIKIVSKEGAKQKSFAGIKVADKYKAFGSFNKSYPSIVSREDYLAHKGENFETFLEELEEVASEQSGKSKFVRVKDFSRVTGKSETAIREMLVKKELKGRKFGATYLIPRSELEIFTKM